MESIHVDDSVCCGECAVVVSHNCTTSLVGNVQVAAAIQSNTPWLSKVSTRIRISTTKFTVHTARSTVVQVGTVPHLIAVGNTEEQTAFVIDNNVGNVWNTGLKCVCDVQSSCSCCQVHNVDFVQSNNVCIVSVNFVVDPGFRHHNLVADVAVVCVQNNAVQTSGVDTNQQVTV